MSLNTSEFRVDYNRALASIPEHIVGRDGVPDLTDPMASYRYLEKKRQTVIDSVRQRPLIRLWDNDMKFIGEVAGERSVMVEEVMADSGAGNIVLRRDNWLSEFVLNDRRMESDVHITLDPIATKPDWRTRWGGKVVTVNAKRDAQGTHNVELQMVSNREHLKHILAAANPIFPPEIQLPKIWLLPWNLRTGISITMFINLARQFFPALAIPTNIFNPGAWLDSLTSGPTLGLNPLDWPMQVQFVNPITDQSRFSVLTSRWDNIHNVTAPLLEDAGCMIRAYTYLVDDDRKNPSPHPELAVGLKNIPLVGDLLDRIADNVGLPDSLDDLARPNRNAIVFAVEDKSGTTGPTGTLLDGPIKLAAGTADDLFTEIFYDVTGIDSDADKDGETDPFFAKLAGTAPDPPWAIFRDGQYSGIVESQRTLHAATAKTVMVGSKSPPWVNQLQTFGIKFGLSQIQSVITAGLFGQSGPAPVGSGLEEAYQGQLDNVLLAWQKFTDPVRAQRMGDFGFLEHFERGAGTAYTVASVLDIRNGHWKTRAFSSFKTTVRNGAPWLVGYDFVLGDRLGFQMANLIHVDQCTAIKWSWDDSSAVTVSLSIGDDKEEKDPISRASSSLAGLWNAFSSLTGSGDLF